MFWGLIMEPHKRYTQKVEKAFHLSMASLDASSADDSKNQVMICYDNRNYLLCTLQKGSIWQVPLDLNFSEGTKISFSCNGGGHVHLTGYLVPEDPLDIDENFGDEEEDEEGELDGEIPDLVFSKKRKNGNSLSEQKNSKPLKKVKLEVDEDDDEDDDDDDDDDSDLGLGENMSFEDAEDSEDSDDDDDDDEDDEEDDDDDDESEDDEEPSPQKNKKPQKKQKQNQSQQQPQQNHQNQQNKKDKQKMMNGTDKPKKQEPVKQEPGKQKKNKENKVEEKSEKQQNQHQKKRTVEGGVQIEELKEGNGPAAKPGKFVSVYYTGRLKNGKKFDSTTQGEGFKFKLGKGEVIKGWDVGIAGMKVGGKRRLAIPPNMAYGSKGSPPVIPPNSLLNFEVELKAVH